MFIAAYLCFLTRNEAFYFTKSNKWNENVISFSVGQKFMFSKMSITCIIYIKLEKEHLKKGDGKVRKHKLNEIISKITYVYTCNWITLLCTGNVVSQLYFSKIYTLRKKMLSFYLTLSGCHSIPLFIFQQSVFKYRPIPTTSNSAPLFSLENPSVRQSSLAVQGNSFCWDTHSLHIAKFSAYAHLQYLPRSIFLPPQKHFLYLISKTC